MSRITLLWVLSLFLLCSRAPAQTAAADVSGTWFAVLDAMGTKLPVRVDLTAAGSTLNGTLQSPRQSPAKLPLDRVSFDGTSLAFALDALGLEYRGVVNGKTVSGIFTQASVDFPLDFTRHRPDGFPIDEGPLTIRARPQDPTDFPYERRSVTFPGGADDVTLAGELTLPGKGKPRAVAVLLGGSGPTDRNAYAGSEVNHSTFLVLSDYLTRRGYAVLRYDDRGVGESTGDFAAATSADMARDAGAAVRYLRTLKDLRRVPVGLIGHSEGGMIAPMVAVADGELDFTVLLAAPALPSDSLMLLQYAAVNESMGVPAAVYGRNARSLRAAYAWIKDNQTGSLADYEEGLYGVFEEQMVNLPAPLRRSITDARAFNRQFVEAMKSPWFRYFIAYDPTEFLERLTVPTLALAGTNDRQVPALENLNALSAAAAVSGNPDVTVRPLIGLNHLFQPSETGAPTEYGTTDVTFDPAALEAIGAWLDERFR